MVQLPILKFEPIVKELVWGGRKLETVLGKSLPSPSTYGESWEIVDLPDDQSVAVNDGIEGTPLSHFKENEFQNLLGHSSLLDGRFPLLFKFIDATSTLSVQVHPNEAACEQIGQGARPKTEAWYIIDRDPGAVLYVGMKEAVTKEQFAKSLQDGTVESLLHKVAVEPGDFIFLPAGTIHAIGAGILLAEVQQSSDTTYRVFDWNRMGLDGKPRQLHVEQALQSTDFQGVGLPKATPPPSGRPGIASDFFVMETVTVIPGNAQVLEGDGPLVLMGVDGKGKGTIQAHTARSQISCGETRLIPASLASDVQVASDDDLKILSVRIP